MKKQNLLSIAALMTLGAIGTTSAAAAQDDAVLMTINGVDVPVSEFNYLYNKNNSQQIEPLTLEDYVERFINYKLKVADAEKAGMDTTATFRAEFENFRRDLARPYLRDVALEDSLVNEAYDHLKQEIYVSHIMVNETPEGYSTLDSIRTAILNGTTTFEDAARAISIDRASATRGGLMGYVLAGRYPFPFEKASFDTPIGQISPIINSGMGYHLVRPESARPARGEVKASHILLLTRNLTPEQAEEAHTRIDSLYNILKATDKDALNTRFAELAREYSQDPGSARNGGDLGWFGSGRMVQEFDSVSFALTDGELSAPFTTSFGYHIILREDSRGIKPLSELRDALIAQMASDERGLAPERRFIDAVIARHNGSLINLNALREMIAANPGGYDEAMIEVLKSSSLPIVSIDGKEYPVSMVMGDVATTKATDPGNAVILISTAAKKLLDQKAADIAMSDLYRTDTDYRNLLNEYRDGMLLFEISNRNVWERSKEDKKGLEEYFRKNRAKYRWTEPKFKSTILFATSDSLLTEAEAYARTLKTDSPEEFVSEMRKKFGKDVKVERVIAAKGENAITDFLAFGGERPATDPRNRWVAYTSFNGRIIDQPEEAIDVRGAAMTDFQTQLENDWIKQLRKKYKYKVNKKVLETL